jgi:serine/threonine-protein kinase
MKFLSDRALERLRRTAELPDMSATQYRLLERVATGGMGTVYAAQDTKLGRRVALKVLDAPDASGELAKRLVREARVLAQLEHPGIVPVHDVDTLADGRVFYTMKFVEGQRLDEHLARTPLLSNRLRLFQRICEPVAFAHARGVLHRDLKPANIMIGPFGEVLVLDWGLAKILHGDQQEGSGPTPVRDLERTIFEPAPAQGGGDTSTEFSASTEHGAVLGTPGYMSPEQSRGDMDNVNERSDVFSLGAILRVLIEGNSTVPPASPRSPRPLAAILQKATEPQPGDRYARVQDLAADVSRFLDGLPVGVYRETVLEKLARFYNRHEFAILLIAVYLAMRLLLLFFPRR